MSAELEVAAARLRLYERRFGILDLGSPTVEEASRFVASGCEMSDSQRDSLVALQRRLVLDDYPEGFGLLGGPLLASKPLCAVAAVDAIGSTVELDENRSDIDFRLFNRLLGATNAVVARSGERLGQKMTAQARRLVKSSRARKPEQAAEIEAAISEDGLSWMGLPMHARAALTLEQEGIIRSLVADEESLFDELILEAQEQVDNEIADAAEADRGAVREAMAAVRADDRARAVQGLMALLATTLINRYTAEDSPTPIGAPIARGILWDTISWAGGVDATAANGLAVAEDGRFIVDGTAARGRYLAQGEKSLRLIEDLNEAKSGERAGVVPEYTFHHSGSSGEERNEIHRRKDNTKWRDGEYREKMFDARSGIIVAPGQFSGCECRVSSVLIETDQPGPRVISEDAALAAVA